MLWSEGTFDKVHDLAETSLERSCDVFMHKESLALVLMTPIPLIIHILPLFVHHPFLLSSITLICP